MRYRKYIPFITIILIVIIGAFLRLYRIGDYMSFLGDEGRDVLIVKRMIVDHKFTLLGPITSVGLMHLGPIYYYFMIPFLWLSRFDPVGPAIMVALFSTATIVLIWLTGKNFFDQRAGLIASLLYALSPLVIVHSHSSWNPNILPFWAMLFIFSLLQIIIRKKYRWAFIAGISLGIIFQLHYVALILLPIGIIALAVNKTKIPIKYYLVGIGGFLLLISPFLIFELRHNLINTKTVLQFVTRTGDAKTFGFISPVNKFWDLTVRLFWRLVVIENAEISIVYLLVLLGLCVWIYKTSINQDIKKSLSVLFVWYLVGMGILSIYTGVTYDYYLMFAFPLPFLLTGIGISWLAKQKYGIIIALLVVTGLSYFQIKQTSILQVPNRLATQTKEIATFVLQQTNNQPYNFALIAGKNSDHAYRYFLEIGGNTPVVIENPTVDPQRLTVTNQLLIVCEEKICQPLGHPLWEIAGFGPAEITNQWQIDNTRVFKLRHY